MKLIGILIYVVSCALAQFCATNLDCTSFYYPRCETSTGYCDKPESDADCEHLEAYFVRINTTLSYCTQCRNDADCGTGYQCRNITTTIQKCLKTCNSDSDCTVSPLLKCVPEPSNPSRKQCVECSGNGNPCTPCVYNGFCNTTCSPSGGKAPQLLASNALFSCSHTLWDGKFLFTFCF